MKKYRFLLVVVVLIFIALGLSACVQKASTPPPSDSEFPVPDEPMDVLKQSATQTAVAMSEGTEPTTEEGAPVAEEGAPTAESASGDTEVGAGQTEQQPTEPTATPAPPAEVPTFEVPETYVLQAGEFPYCIARRFNVDVSALLSASGLSSSSTFLPGTTLTIPKGAAAFNNGARALRAHPTQHTVQAGETVYSIACLFGDVDPRAIEAVNNLTAGYSLSVGQVLQIP
jgi:LysM repeat protein